MIASADQDAERAVLGALIVLGDPRYVASMTARGLRPDHFYWSTHAAIFSAAVSLCDHQRPVDAITLTAELERLKIGASIPRQAVEEMAGFVPAAGHYGEYADRVIELARWRARDRVAHLLHAAAEKRDADGWSRAAADLDLAIGGTRTESYSPEQWAALMFDYFSGTPESAAKLSVPMPFNRLTDVLGGGLRPGEWLALSGPSSHGKALALATPILTTDGWSTMGEVRLGQYVFSPSGRPTRVRAATGVMLGHECFEVGFSDRACITADADHLWAFETNERERRELARVDGRRARSSVMFRAEHIETTAALAEYVASQPPRVRYPAALERPEADLLVSPYLLGLWLGDGTHRGGTITMATEDARWAADAIQRLGYEIAVRYDGNAGSVRVGARPWLCRRGHLRHGRWNRCRECHRDQAAGRPLGLAWNVPLSVHLRTLGVLHPSPKRIPRTYMEASVPQRLELLRGLVDSDGSVGLDGWVEIVSTLPELKDDIVELVAALGGNLRVYERTLTPGKRGTDRAWRIIFTLDIAPSRLPRKRDRWRPPTDRRRYRYVREVRPVPSVPVRCISVEAEDGMFLAGRELVPTHNSIVADQMLDQATKHGKRAHLYMTEMTAVARGMRLIARRTGVPFMRQRRLNLTDADRAKILAELSRLGYGCSVAAGWDVDDIVRDALRARYDFVVVDLLHGFHYEDERGLDRLSKAMQRLARVSTTLDGHEGTAVVAVTHLKEEGTVRGKVPRPTITSIKGGSSIKQDADFVMFVWQDQGEAGEPTGEGKIWLAKGRSGELASVDVTLNVNRFRFELPAVDRPTAPAPEQAAAF